MYSDIYILSDEFERDVWEHYPWMRCKTDGDNDYQDLTYWPDIPNGWRIAFGIQWLNDIDAFYQKLPDYEKEEFRPLQLKEKYGSFRQYWSTYYEDLEEILDKYEALSEQYCICCGAPAVGMTTNGWIEPFCQSCADREKVELNLYEKDGIKE